MVEHSRYHVKDDAVDDAGILKNKLNIKDKTQLDHAETLLLADAYVYFFKLLKHDQIKFDLFLLFSVHKYFFETLYDWAGKIRMVDISKDDIFFAPIKYIDIALNNFNKLLKINVPRQDDTKNDIAKKLAIIHNEFNVIHPFREGNGRTIRLFLDLMSSNAGYDPVDWSKKSNSNYLKACVEGVKGNHEVMTKLIKLGLKKQHK